jgi:hypothetical protein
MGLGSQSTNLLLRVAYFLFSLNDAPLISWLVVTNSFPFSELIVLCVQVKTGMLPSLSVVKVLCQNLRKFPVKGIDLYKNF